MSSTQATSAETAAPPPLETVRAHLEQVRRRILTDIQHYPTPIPHCDQQFNWLLEQRDGVTAGLYALDELRERARQAPPYHCVQQGIEAARSRILAEIQHYPTPIAHCDQQFNWLLEQRDRVSAELNELDALRERAQAALAAFLDGSQFVGRGT